MRHLRHRLVVGLSVALLAASLAPFGWVAAGGPPPRLQLEAEPGEDGLWILRAALSRDGQPQTGQPVEFFQLVDFFGERAVPLGATNTDATGTAILTYSPTSNGVQQLVARHTAGSETYASGPVEITVNDAVPAIPVEGQVLPIMRMWAFPVGAVLLVTVWLALAGILLGAVIGIARSKRDPENMGTPASPGVGSGDLSPGS